MKPARANYSRHRSPTICCPVCWHRHGRALDKGCTAHTAEEKLEYRRREKIKEGIEIKDLDE